MLVHSVVAPYAEDMGMGRVDGLIAVGLLMAGTVRCGAQQAGENAPAAGSGLVQMDVAVTTGAGVPVSGLTAADFSLLEDKKPEPIETVEPMTAASVPTEAILLIDDINTGITTIAKTRQQVEQYLRSNGGKLPFPMRLAIATDTGTMVGQSATMDGNSLATQLGEAQIGIRDVRQNNVEMNAATELFQTSVKALGEVLQVTSRVRGRK